MNVSFTRGERVWFDDLNFSEVFEATAPEGPSLFMKLDTKTRVSLHPVNDHSIDVNAVCLSTGRICLFASDAKVYRGLVVPSSRRPAIEMQDLNRRVIRPDLIDEVWIAGTSPVLLVVKTGDNHKELRYGQDSDLRDKDFERLRVAMGAQPPPVDD